jgi:hypothetical protein
MEDEGWLALGVAAAMAKEHAAHQVEFLDWLARFLGEALPDHVTVERKGSLFAREKPVSAVRIELGEEHYVLAGGSRGGALKAQRSLVKRGIVLRTEDLPVERWIADLGEALEGHSRQNQAAASALRKFFG